MIEEDVEVRQMLIVAGVKNLREFGYPTATEENILTDMVFAPFFKEMLFESIEQRPNTPLSRIASMLLAEIGKNET